MKTRRIAAAKLSAWCRELLTAHGVSVEQADVVTTNLIWCELVGRDNFGLERLPIFVKRLRKGAIKGDAKPRFVSPELLDGDRAFGHYAAELAMRHAMELAGARGIAAVGVHNSNFFGAGAYFVKLACERGMMGLALSNSFPKVAAHGGWLPVLGTNPFAFGAPRQNGEHLLVDMATSAFAGSTVRDHIDGNTPLPEGLAVDASGKPMTDARKIEAGALLPFGGAKGFGLALMVELLAGVLTGAGIGAGVGSMYKDFERPADNGHFLIAIDIRRWMDSNDYFSRFESLAAMVKASSPDGGVLLPGEVRWATLRENQARGIPIDDELFRMIEILSTQSGLAAPFESEAA